MFVNQKICFNWLYLANELNLLRPFRMFW